MTGKSKSEYWPLYKAALITSPIIALMVVTPVFLTTRWINLRFEYIFPIICFFIFIAWLIHIRIIKRTIYKTKWIRLVIVSTIMIVFSTIAYLILKSYINMAGWAFHTMRILNILSVNGIIYMISNYILLSRTKKELDIENEQLKFANLEARYQTLKNQVNPHFLFNSIGTAKALIRKNPAIADEYLVKLSDFLRLGFDNKFDIITVKEELALCLDYIALQRMRFGDALEFITTVEDKYAAYHVPHFSILSLIENAVKHNSMTEEEPLLITVKNEHDLLIVENNIQQKFLLETSSKTGLNNLTERYRLLFDELVTIQHEATVFRVTIKMIRK